MSSPRLGVVLVTFNSADVILDCLESLMASNDTRLSIVVIDNGSTDGTPALIRQWAAGATPAPLADLPFEVTPTTKPLEVRDEPREEREGHSVALMETGENLGFAGGVNRGLEALGVLTGCDRFWILNPDSVVPPGSAFAFATEPGPVGGFSLMGGRVNYFETPDLIQIDGGTIDWATGVTRNVNRLASHKATRAPEPERFDFITGASMVASRAFVEAAGPMPEEYFLYYEEVDWALRREDLPLAYCPDGLVLHRAGTAIGSPAPGRPATPFSLYFKHRARLMFLRRYRARNIATAQAWSIAKAVQLTLQGEREGAVALLTGAFGFPPSTTISSRLPPGLPDRLGRSWKRPQRDRP